MGEQSFSNSYMITNRAYPWKTWYWSIYPAEPDGALFYFLACGANNPHSSEYTQIYTDPEPSTSMPPNFQSALEADIERAKNADPNHPAEVTLYIHGFAYLFSDACRALGTFGQNLAVFGSYKGLLIGFSWPSYGSFDSWWNYSSLPYSFPPTAESGTIRDNIHGSTRSLLNLLSMLAPLCKKHGAKLNLLCHSEGNYMLMLAMYALSRSSDPALSQLAGSGPFLDQVLLLAADINNGALEPPKTVEARPVSGQGSWIAQYSKRVTVYWSGQDDLLPFSDGWTEYHNSLFPNRLGLHGPDSFSIGCLLPNVFGLDCSLVVNSSNPYRPCLVTVHESYFYTPQVLEDMSQTLAGVPPAEVVHRVSAGEPDNQAFKMRLAPSPMTAPSQPRGARPPKEAPVGVRRRGWRVRVMWVLARFSSLKLWRLGSRRG